MIQEGELLVGNTLRMEDHGGLVGIHAVGHWPKHVVMCTDGV